MRRIISNLMALTGGLLIGGVLAFASGNVHAASVVFKSPNTLIMRTPSGFLTLSNPPPAVSLGTQSVLNAIARQGGVAVSANLPVVYTGGKAAVTVPVSVARGVAAGAVGRLAVGVLRGSIQGIVIGAAVSQAVKAAGYECDSTGCYQTGTSTQTVNATVESFPATSNPVGSLTGTIKTWYYPNSSPTTTVGSFTEVCDLVRSRAGKVKGTCNDTEIRPVPIDVSPWNAGVCRYSTDYGCSQTSDGPTVQSSCESGYSMSFPGGVAVCKNSQPVLTCPEGYAPPLNGQCEKLVCPAGYTLDGIQCVSDTVTRGPMVTDDQVGDAIGGSIPLDDGVSVVQQALNQGVPVPAGDPVVSGPASVTSQPTVTTSQTTNNTTNTTTTTTTTNTTTVNPKNLS